MIDIKRVRFVRGVGINICYLVWLFVFALHFPKLGERCFHANSNTMQMHCSNTYFRLFGSMVDVALYCKFQ